MSSSASNRSILAGRAKFSILAMLLFPIGTLLVCTSLSFSASPQERPYNPVPSIAELRTRADAGDAAAQHYLFHFLTQYNSRTPDYDIALDWLRRLAVRNQPDALYLLGFLYEHGHGLHRSYAKAAENYRAAALLGDDSAQNNLASLYQHGNGVPKNVKKAIDLYLVAARQGNTVAQCNLASLYFAGSDVPQNLIEAARWFRAAAEQRYPAAQHNLAVLYFKGLGVPVDYAQALTWERLAADQRYPEAEASLGYVYETGRGVPLDYVAAFAWYSRASAHGEHTASERLKALSRSMTHRQLNEASALSSKLLAN